MKNRFERRINVMRSIFDFESASFSESAFTSWWFGKDVFTVVTGNDGLSVTEDNWGLVASSTFNIHEVGVWSWNQSFQFVSLSFLIEGWVKNISFHYFCCWCGNKKLLFNSSYFKIAFIPFLIKEYFSSTLLHIFFISKYFLSKTLLNFLVFHLLFNNLLANLWVTKFSPLIMSILLHFLVLL